MGDAAEFAHDSDLVDQVVGSRQIISCNTLCAPPPNVRRATGLHCLVLLGKKAVGVFKDLSFSVWKLKVFSICGKWIKLY